MSQILTTKRPVTKEIESFSSSSLVGATRNNFAPDLTLLFDTISHIWIIRGIRTICHSYGPPSDNGGAICYDRE